MSQNISSQWLCRVFMHKFYFLRMSELQVSLYLASGKEGNQLPNLKTIFWAVWVLMTARY